MINHYISKVLKQLALLVFILSTGINYSQNFSQSKLNFNGIGSVNRITSLMYGPDGRLYSCEYEGLVKIFTVERAGNSQYKVVAMETLNGIQTIQNHNDDGSLDNTTFRQTTGLTVAGTSSKPIIYVTSSDIRVGGGNHGGGGDIGLDTNSGTITRFTWNGTTWDVVDIVRGLPRSEENHALSGLEFVNVNGTDYLIVTSGGNTNLGSPGYNFTYLPEFALSAAVISVNLDMIETLPIQTVNNRKFIYDIPTLDDPTRPNVNGITDPDAPGYDGIDINDPFGGNDGLNQAKIVPGGPVQIFSPGYRNTYDIVVTEKGAVFATDNGANGGWGGLPFNEGLLDVEGNSLATNNYVIGEPGSSSQSGERANNLDHLQWITNDIQNYTFGSLYGGHAHPTRANPFNSGWYTAPEQFGNAGAVFRTQVYDPDGSTPGSTTNPNIALPADWPPVPTDQANPVEGDFRGPGQLNPDGPDDQPILIWGTNTNGIDEYTASNFDGAMKGDLLAGTNTGELRRVQLKEDNTLKAFNPSFVSGLGGNALGVTCNSDFDIFPGTIWIGNFNNSISVLEPQDFIVCINPDDEGYDANADYDDDGYTNQDELDNATDPCNGASQPQDFDKLAGGVLISDLNDPDDDNDGITDAFDPFQLGNPNTDGSDAFIVPVVNELFSDTFLGGYRGLGFTGIMNNGDTGVNWLNWLDRRDDPNDPNPNDILGGAIGAMTMQMTSGTALGLANNQEKGFQYGVQVDQNTGMFTVSGGIVNFNQPLQLYGNSATPNGELGFYIGDGTQSNYIKFVARPQGLRVQQEINDIPQPPIDLLIDTNDRPIGSIIFNFIVNPSSGEITFEYIFDNDPPQILGSLFAEGSILKAIQESTLDLAVGLIGTSNAPETELEGTWGVLNVTPEAINPIIAESIENQTHTEGDVLDGTFGVTASGGDGTLSYTATGLPLGLSMNPTTGKISGNISLNASNGSPYNVTIVIDDSDFDSYDVHVINFNWTVSPFLESSNYYTVPIIRVNAGGSSITNSDNSGVNWIENTSTGAFTNSVYSVTSGSNIVGITGISRHESIPDHIDTDTFNRIFGSERWDGAGGSIMEFAFPLPNASYMVNIFLANSYSGTNDPGERVFNIAIEGTTVRSGLDLINEFGHKVGGMLSFLVNVTDGTLNLRFLHGLIQNPLVNAIEIRSIILGSPILANEMENQINTEGDALDGSLGVIASGGEGNLSYTAIGLPPGIVIEPINGQIGGAIALDAAANSPYNVTIIVDDSDDNSDDAITLNFNWIVNSLPPPSGNTIPLLRVNTGGSLIVCPDNESVNWTEDLTNGAFSGNGYSVTSGNSVVGITEISRHASIPDYIDINTFNQIFGSERLDDDEAPEMEFSFPLANADYLVNIFLADSNIETNEPGERIFDIAIEGQVSKTGMDIAAEFGHKVGGMISFPVTITDGILNILFLHGSIDDPLVNAIEIREFVIEDSIVVVTPENQANNEGDILNGSLQVIASGGDGTLAFSAIGLPPGVTIDPDNGQITGTIISEPGIINTYDVTVTVDDDDAFTTDAVSVSFSWTVTNSLSSSSLAPLYRVNAGGNLLTDTGSDVHWEANNTIGTYNGTNYSVNTGRITKNITGMVKHTSIPSYIDTATFNALFATERWAPKSPSGMVFSFPITNGDYVVNLFLGSSYYATNDPGERVFNISIEGSIVRSNLDLVTEFGHKVGGMLSFPVNVTDGMLNIEFLHGTIDNPLVNAIEIMSFSEELPILTEPIANQFNSSGDILDGSLQVIASGGDGALSFSATGLPPGVTIDPDNGQITGAIDFAAGANSPYNVSIIVDDSDAFTNDAVLLNFIWTINDIIDSSWGDKNENENYTARHENSFVQAGNKFYVMGGRENARTIDIYDYTLDSWTSLQNSAPFEFNHFQATEYQGLIWVIGSFQTNDYPNEVPAEFIWLFDPSSQEWIQGPQIPITRRRGASGLVVYNDKFYIVGGNTDGHDGGYVAWFDEFNPVTGEWTTLADAPRPRDHFFAAIIGDKLYAAGGRLSGGDGGVFAPTLSEIDVYDFINGTWSTLSASQNIPTPRAGAATAAFENKLFIIGGEVSNQSINGVMTSDALPITEIYDPEQLTWTRGSDLNHKRHGTQAIVSGGGIHILGGSPNLGGGNQKNMEYYGIDNPVGNTSISSMLSAPSEVITVNESNSSNIALNVTGGNIGIPIQSISIEGINSGDFQISSGGLSNGLIKANSTHVITVIYNGATDNTPADLVINYGTNNSAIISLLGTTNIIVSNISNQSNYEGDVLNGSLSVEASGGNGTLSFSATGLPPGVTMDPDNGQITGTIISEPGIVNTYDVTVTVDDDDAFTTDAVSVSFSWTVTNSISSLSLVPLYRINAGGTLLTATDSDVNWEANNTSGIYNGTNYTVSAGNITKNITDMVKHTSIPSYIDNATFNALFTTERWSPKNSPGMVFSFPITNGDYVVNLYLGNSYYGTNDPGERVFNISIEGSIVRSNLDLAAEFGHKVGGMLSFPVNVTDGILNIQFLHGPFENPLVNAIEIQKFVNIIASKPSSGSKFNLTDTNELSLEPLQAILYPNPASLEALIKVSNSSPQISDIYVNDISGRLIKTYKASQLKYGTDLYRLDVSELSNGMYFINLKTVDASVLGFKLLVQK